jgi:hypothetical protein
MRRSLGCTDPAVRRASSARRAAAGGRRPGEALEAGRPGSDWVLVIPVPVIATESHLSCRKMSEKSLRFPLSGLQTELYLLHDPSKKTSRS